MFRFVKSLSLIVIIAATTLIFRVHSSPRTLPQTDRADVGRITGRVLDSNGREIVNAKVIALNGGPTVTPPQADSDRNGNFHLDNVPPGVYTLYGHKEDEGYPDRMFSFYNEGAVSNAPVVTVYANQTTPNAIIQLEKAALLKGHVIDGATGKLPIEHATVWLRQALDPERSLRLGTVKGEFQIPVPSLAITVKVTEPGYEDWHYTTPEAANRDSVLLLAPETTQELQIVMTRKKRIR